ncbi:hypothetical protein [Ferrimonas gelatinilytica]|uniref:Methyltransferase domain-containing protein n=1 Tax=Ferrimonas gelatinilytica TaxID=1255257 RepID=A0ABP9S420_9GAMM
MTLILRSLGAPDQEASPSSFDRQAQARFLLHKLAVRRGEKILVHGQADAAIVAQLAASVGNSGCVTLLQESTDGAVTPLGFGRETPQVVMMQAGPTQDAQEYDAVVITPHTLSAPSEAYLDAAWRRVRKGGRVMLALPQGDEFTAQLRQLVTEAGRTGFASRYRRCCDKHCVWIGVKYSR